jgi:hypothetical protein
VVNYSASNPLQPQNQTSSKLLRQKRNWLLCKAVTVRNGLGQLADFAGSGYSLPLLPLLVPNVRICLSIALNALLLVRSSFDTP